MTAYHWEPTAAKYARRPSRYNQVEVDVSEEELRAWEERHNPYPNKSPTLCLTCAEDYRSSWQEQWDQYYSGLL